ncbi:hypothetical protein [Streptomyces formicae]|uniref:Roadblock/LAMTOR2 domain-containing protein n=1 Tax=Streptomyces formicae TaxID=1616117 RepID=A0ABY3WSE2_9ACTN|nr:hypothetical protein [Streptomyces formicae]UNM15554.1 hypothetical protein J4032_32485 [Streptomyces formicae]
MPGIDECLLHAMRLPGARGAALVDWTSGLALGTVGDAAGDDHETAAAETAELARMAAEHPTFAPVGPADSQAPVEDLVVTTRTCYHVLRFVETSFDSSVLMHLWLDRAEGNLALARLRMRDLTERLVLE